MSETKNYTVQDIERYHSGDLSPAQRHALEKAALDDPFLADALEGFASAQTPQEDLNNLRQKLQLRIEKDKKRRGLFYIGNAWMKVAALIVLMAGGGWLMVQLSSNKAAKFNQTVAVKQPGSPVQNSVADSSTLPSNAAPDASQSISETENKKGPSIVARSSAASRKAHANKPEQLPPAAASALVVVQDSTNHLDGYIARQAAPPSLAKAEAFKKSLDDAKDKERSGFTRTTDTINNFNVMMKRSDEGLQEVVISKAQKKPVRRMNVTIDSLEPAEGWTNFDDYVASHIKEPEELKEKRLKGEVELSFEVNGEGEPVNITVTRSLCARCDEEAIRILKEGPKWKNKKKKGKIKIKFPSTE